MFFTLKKKLMCRAIEKRNRQHPFDYAAAENYTLAPDADPLVNNSYYFSAHDEKMSLFARLGKRVHQDETWFVLFIDGKLYSLGQELFPAGDSPIRVEKKGEIMVARFTDIGWTPYYSVVNGLITEIGSSLSHGAVVAREYGLPTIVNVKGATKILKNGDHIVMNADKGTILCS